MRYFLDLAYDGSGFHGWQEQENANTVQQEINEALSTLLSVPVKCVGSGRTDTGVHARQQIAHFDARPGLSDPDRFLYQLNSLLPPAIAIKGISKVRDTAHARFDATRRTYQYHLHSQKDPFSNGQSYFLSAQLDIKQIDLACVNIRGHKDFESFSRVKTDVNHFDCEIFEINWRQLGHKHLFEVSANRFLRGMVRTMVGTLIDIGTGKLSLDDLDLILSRKDRRLAGRAVPAQGLFLTEVSYPSDLYI